MTLLPTELIRKKRFGGAHSREEIRFLVQGYSDGSIEDYQMSAWLMAVCWRGMTAEETSWLTLEMRDSGAVMDLSSLGLCVDKHSTGGIGDKTSLILAPLVAAAGIPVPMMAGRGLGHTGGTLDKLESIPGFNVGLSLEQFKKQVAGVGTAIIGQTLDICPADRKLYALRDVTGTIDSMPLICGSIMSKKLAAGVGALVLDVKFGSGAFMKSQEDAESLARALIDIGTRAGKKVVALLTRMDEPLGRFTGNALEVRECVEIMRGEYLNYAGKKPTDTVELTLDLAAHMIFLGGQSRDVKDGRMRAKKLLEDGSAWRKFEEMCLAQGGDLKKPLPLPKTGLPVAADERGYIEFTDLEKMGLAAVVLGAGRRVQSDKIDFTAGIETLVEQGQAVDKGQDLFKIYGANESRFIPALELLNQAYRIVPQPVNRGPLVAKVVT